MKIKIITIILIFCMFSIILPFKNVYATAVGDIFSKADKFIENGDSADSVINSTKLEDTSKFLYNTLLAIGVVVMVLVGVVLGIQFMMSSVGEKAKIKEALIAYTVGCAVILGAFTIWSIVVNIGQDIVPETSSSAEGSENP